MRFSLCTLSLVLLGAAEPEEPSEPDLPEPAVAALRELEIVAAECWRGTVGEVAMSRRSLLDALQSGFDGAAEVQVQDLLHPQAEVPAASLGTTGSELRERVEALDAETFLLAAHHADGAELLATRHAVSVVYRYREPPVPGPDGRGVVDGGTRLLGDARIDDESGAVALPAGEQAVELHLEQEVHGGLCRVHVLASTGGVALSLIAGDGLGRERVEWARAAVTAPGWVELPFHRDGSGGAPSLFLRVQGAEGASVLVDEITLESRR